MNIPKEEIETIYLQNGVQIKSNNIVVQQQQNQQEPRSVSRKITLDLRGIKYSVYAKDLARLPSSCRLVKLKNWLEDSKSNPNDINEICDDYNLETNEFYFNRDPHFLNLILDYTYSNKLHINDLNSCIYKILDELAYWNIDDNLVETCCSIELGKRKEMSDETLEKRELILKSINKKDPFTKHRLANLRRKLWNIFENPSNSIWAKIYFFILFWMIMLSTFDLVLRTIPAYSNSDAFDYTEIICISLFSAEWIFRFLVSPNKLHFIINPLNIADLVSILPFYLNLVLSGYDILEVIKNISRIFRTFSIFKLVKHSSSVQTLSNTLKYSYKEISVYLLYLGMGLFTFSSLVYYSEYQQPGTKFLSIPDTFW